MIDPYNLLAEALDNLPNTFPRTSSGIELEILKMIATPDEALLASRLSGSMEDIETIASRVSADVNETRKALMRMAKKGMVWFERSGGKAKFRLAPFVVGLYEAQWERMDHELAHMFEHYLVESGADIMKHLPAFHRAAPVQSGAHMEWILPYDHVRKILQNSKSFHIRDCICRLQQKHIGKGCDRPLHVCMAFTKEEGAFREGAVDMTEALSVLDLAEQQGLVHSVSNVREGMNYMCNCCGCCCTLLRGIREYGLKGGMAAANYNVEFNQADCSGCGVCAMRCQTGAISMNAKKPVIDSSLCIGCGLCTTTCHGAALNLVLKPEKELIHPPFDYETWENIRASNRDKPASE